MGFMWIIWIIIIIAIILFVRSYFSPARGEGELTKESALDVLKKRYARGEISKAEFEGKKRDLI